MATVTLNWLIPQSGGPVDSYNVYRVAQEETTASVIVDPVNKINSAPLPNTPRTYVDDSVSSGDGVYSYTVTAVNEGGESVGATPTTQTL
jgi:hypothetical protein